MKGNLQTKDEAYVNETRKMLYIGCKDRQISPALCLYSHPIILLPQGDFAWLNLAQQFPNINCHILHLWWIVRRMSPCLLAPQSCIATISNLSPSYSMLFLAFFCSSFPLLYLFFSFLYIFSFAFYTPLLSIYLSIFLLLEMSMGDRQWQEPSRRGNHRGSRWEAWQVVVVVQVPGNVVTAGRGAYMGAKEWWRQSGVKARGSYWGGSHQEGQEGEVQVPGERQIVGRFVKKGGGHAIWPPATACPAAGLVETNLRWLSKN